MKKMQHCLSVLKGKLEKAPTPLFTDKRYKEIRKNEFDNKHGVYALYNKKGRLYYVGRASNMKNRLYNHLRNKHSSKWHYFSVYFTNSAQQAKELESIIISIDKPKGNTQKPRLKVIDRKMKSRIKKSMKVIDRERRKFGVVRASKKNKLKKATKKRSKIKVMRANKKSDWKKQGNKQFKTGNKTFDSWKQADRKSKAGNKSLSLVGLFSENKLLKGERTKRGEQHKKVYPALLLTSGKVLYKGKKYTLSGAGKVATGLNTNGWDFWHIKDHQNRWIKLNDLRKKKAMLKKVA